LVDASSNEFHLYKTGILDSEKCGTDLSHAVVAIGYGIEKGKPYYIVRNSWGASWGD
jgi:C1A family cysteine protease